LQRGPAEPGDSTGSYAATQATVSLGDLVDHGVLRRALAAEPLVSTLFHRLGDPKPASLFALTSILVEANGPVQRGCRAEFTRDMLSRFAVQQVDADRAQVRVALATSDSACLESRPELSLVVPLQAFSAEIGAAMADSEGILLLRARAIADSGTTVIRYALPQDAPRRPERSRPR
ncbi:MAG: hypothetical protein H0U67_06820, partial [Gemmatimonadetes bacterium]|nr:hypothetical protein [Gemmatimonadota bacterium]